MTTRHWKDIVAKKRLLQQQAIDSPTYHNEGETTDRTFDPTEISHLTELSGKIARRELSSEEVTRAYIKRALIAHEKTNCLTEILFQDSIKQARDLDRYIQEQGKPVGPLHGVPMTLKDQFDVKGYDTTLGYTGRSFRPASQDAILVQMLRELGAVIIAKTNLPQSIMWCETENPLWGLTTNPLSAEYTPGGSTGGESALLNLKGSLVGWGTDIGGSIRIPSHMMGLYGLKPSSGRLPYFGVPVSTEGQEHVPSSIGPLARSLSSIYQVMKTLILSEPWLREYRCAPIPWRGEVYEEVLHRKLTIGILRDDGAVKPLPPISRVLNEVAAALVHDGHELVEWPNNLHAECIQVMDQFYTVDGGEDIRRDVEAGGEPFIPHVKGLVNRAKAISIYEYWQLNKRKTALQQAYLGKWNSIKSPKTGKPVDVLLMPVMPHPAVPHGGCRWVGYTKVWNFLDYTAISIPGGHVEMQDCGDQWDHPPRNAMEEWNGRLWEERKTEMAGLKLPVGIQLVGRRLEEEKVLAASKILDDLICSGV